MTPILSICIATYNRGKFIGETLDSILSQMQSGVELIVVDGASPDNTPEVMVQYLSRCPEIRYYREQENSGVDKDYDKAVSYAAGEYCWLMTDDDLLRPNAIKHVLKVLEGLPDLVVVNAEVRNSNFSCVLQERRWPIVEDKQYEAGQIGEFFRATGSNLSFIGAVVIRRKLWLARDRASYYGTLFIHFGVIFQHTPIEKVYAVAEPLIVIRYGNAMWTPRSFEIWMFKWPRLVWSFDDFSESDKQCVSALEPWRNRMRLLNMRATGEYSSVEFYKFLSPCVSGVNWLAAYLIAVFPPTLVNLYFIAYFVRVNQSYSIAWYDLLRSNYATRFNRWIVKIVRRPEYDKWAHSLSKQSSKGNVK